MQKLKSSWNAPRLRYSLFAGGIIALILLLIWYGNLFTPTRLRIDDVFYAPAETSDRIVIVAIDDDSLTRYGRTPVEWSRAVYADLIAVLGAGNARVIAFDLLFSTTQPEDEVFAEALANLRQSDARTRIVLADAGINFNPNVVATDDSHVLTYSDRLPLSPILVDNADYLGFANALTDSDGVIRKQPSLIQVNDAQGVSFSIATYLAYLRIPASATSQIISAEGDTLNVTPERQLTVDDYGMWRQYYFGSSSIGEDQTFTTVSLSDVIDGNVDLALFDDKIVLVGLSNNVGELDKYRVPSSASLMSGIEIQANAIESLLQARFVEPIAPFAQASIIVLLAVGASLIYARPRWYFKIVLAAGLIFAWFILTSLIYSISTVSISLFDTMLALGIPLIISVGIDITLETVQRQQKEFLLSSLQRIAEQHLQLPQAAQYILEDVGNIVPKATATLLVSGDNGAYHYFHHHAQDGKKSDSKIRTQEVPVLIQQATGQKIIRETGRTLIPLAWQNKQQGLLVIEHPKQTRLDHADEQLLSELTRQLAPNLENMRLYEQTQRQKSLLDAVFAESPAGIAIVDVEGQVVQSNHYLTLLLDAKADTIVGRSLPDLIAKKADDDGFGRQLLDGIRSRQNFDLLEVKLGQTSARIDVAPLQHYALWVVVVGDVTSLVELNKLKTQMLRIASHDLKNPLARIIGFATLVEMDQNLTPEQARYVKFIRSGGDEMLHIIDDNLNLDRLRSGKIFLEDVDFNRLVSEVCASHQPDTIQKQQELVLELPSEPVHVTVDRSYISQAVTNLVGNAIKYTPDNGKIMVRLIVEPKQTRFEVEDTGYGIPAESQEKLFTEFYRAKSRETAHIPGTGLGLSLVKSAIEAHGGKIDFKSVAGEGSTFYFTLPKGATSK